MPPGFSVHLKLCLHSLVLPQHLEKKEETKWEFTRGDPCLPCPGKERQESEPWCGLPQGCDSSVSHTSGSVCVHICEDGVRGGVCMSLWGGCVVSRECLACVGRVGEPVCVCMYVCMLPVWPWGRGGDNAHVAQNLPLPVEGSLHVVTKCSCPIGFCPSDSAQALLLLSLRLAPVLGIVEAPAFPIMTGLGLLTPRRKGTATSMSKFLPWEMLSYN